MFDTTRQTLRSLSRAPGLAIAAIATVALGAAFTTSMVAVVDGILFRPLPFREPERVVALRDVNTRTTERDDVSAPNMLDVAAGARTLERTALWIVDGASMSADGLPERVSALRVSPSMFGTLGVTPFLGHGFGGDDLTAHDAQGVMLTYDFWQTRFGGSRAVIGRTIRLNGRSFAIAGVLPPELRFPRGDVALWQPLVLKDFERDYREKRMFHAVARLAPGATARQAAAEVGVLSKTLARQHEENRDWLTEVVPVRDSVTPDSRRLWLLLGGALLVLLLACANVANLLLARAIAMRDHAAIRVAFGATRVDLALHSLREAAVIAVLGTGAGVLLAAWMVRLVLAFGPAAVPTWSHVAVDLRVLAASAGLLIVTTLLAGTAPALVLSREAGDTLRIRARIGGGGRVRRALTALQVALAVVLLVAALLLVRSLAAIEKVDPGFRAAGRIAATLTLPAAAYHDRAREVTLFTRFLEQVRITPGVVSAAAVSSLPMNPVGIDYATEVFVQGYVSDRPPEIDLRLASSRYFATMGVPFLEGRDFAGGDDARAPKVAIVNEAFVRAYAGGRPPLDLTAKIYCDRCDAFTIVGVVANMRHASLEQPARPEIYVPYTQLPHGELTYVVRGDRPGSGVIAAMRRELQQLDPDLALASIAPVDEILARSVDSRRFNARVLAAFSLCALLLAAIGLYGSLSFSIGQRHRDIAVRVALGAQHRHLWRLVAIEASSPVAAGVLAGLAGSALAARALRTMIYGVGVGDPVSYAIVLALFAGIVAAVTVAGFRRASRADATELLADV